MPKSNVCLHCGRKLHNAVFCRGCSGACCSWTCYLQHVAGHGDVPDNRRASAYARGSEDDSRRQAAVATPSA
jgi:hypothetical protein